MSKKLWFGVLIGFVGYWLLHYYTVEVLSMPRAIQATPLLFGARGDGSADDTQAIQDLIDSQVPVMDGLGLRYYTSRPLMLNNARCGRTIRGFRFTAQYWNWVFRERSVLRFAIEQEIEKDSKK